MGGWKGYVIMAHAIIDPEAAWAEAQQLTSYDDGNTKSNTLYWIGTRPGSNDCPDCTTRPPQPTNQPTNRQLIHPWMGVTAILEEPQLIQGVTTVETILGDALDARLVGHRTAGSADLTALLTFHAEFV